MNRTLTALLLSGAMLCAMATPALALKAENTAQILPISVQEAPAMFDSAMTDSSLYYGTVTGLVRLEPPSTSPNTPPGPMWVMGIRVPCGPGR